MKELFELIRDYLPEHGLKYKHLKFTLNEYYSIQAVFNKLVKSGEALTFMDNVVKFFALNGLEVIPPSPVEVNWLIKKPINF